MNKELIVFLLVVVFAVVIEIGLYAFTSYKLEKRYKKMKTDFYRWRR